MKSASKLILLIVAVLFSQAMSAQDLKFGHIDSQQLLQLMPEMETVQAQLETYGQQLQNELENLAVELNNAQNQYEQKKAGMTDLLRQTKEEELATMTQRLQRYQQTSQQDYNNKQQELLGPVIEKARKAIEEVAKEQGMIYVFDISQGAVIYNSDQSVDMLPLVKARLGIKDIE